MKLKQRKTKSAKNTEKTNTSMDTNSNVFKSINPYRFAIILIVTYLVLSQGNLFMNSVLSTGGKYHNEFLYNNFNYIQWLRSVLIVPSKWIIESAGFETMSNKEEILVIGGIKLNVNYSCLGLGAMSFVLAYLLAFPRTFKKKTVVFIFTSLVIFVLNIFRISALGIILSKFKEQRASLIYHHEIFNILIYLVVLFIFYRWVSYNIKENSKQH